LLRPVAITQLWAGNRETTTATGVALAATAVTIGGITQDYEVLGAYDHWVLGA
jgi:hypothetical protein